MAKHLIATFFFVFCTVIACKNKNTDLSNPDAKVSIPDSGPNKSLDLSSPISVNAESNEATNDALLTYCARETAATPNADMKKWRDAFSFEVMERICNRRVGLAKDRVDFSDRTRPMYRETAWTHGINLTGITLQGYARGTAVTSRHVVYTAHLSYHGQPGETVQFLTMDNRVITRKIVDVKYVSDDDLAVARLDADLPGSITPLKLLDPASAKLVPDLVPMLRINQHNKALIVDKRGEYPGKPGEQFPTVLRNPPERAFGQYYQDMVRFDSSSPTVLLLRNQFGVMPILFSLVTLNGTGQGPVLHKNVAKIQQIIAAFGDKHRLEMAIPQTMAEPAPSCSLEISRSQDEKICNLTVTASANALTENPLLQPSNPVTWKRAGQRWYAAVQCPADPTGFFIATMTGPGGRGRGCESAPVGPMLPQCTLNVTRQGNSALCDVELTKIAGNHPANPLMNLPDGSSEWKSHGNRWTTTTPCALNSAIRFSAKLTDPNGVGHPCAAIVDVAAGTPTCELTAHRKGYDEICELVVTRKSGSATGEPAADPVNPANWVRNGDQYKGTVHCPAEKPMTFSTYFSGLNGPGPACTSPSILAVSQFIPFCDLEASRVGRSNQCRLTARFRRGIPSGLPPVSSPRNPATWQRIGETFDYKGSVPCAQKEAHQFSAFFPAAGNIPGRICKAAIVEKI